MSTINIIFLLSILSVNAVYDIEFARAVVEVANKYFKLRSRLIFYLSDDFDPNFNEAISAGHNVPVVLQESPLAPIEEMKKAINYKCDAVVVVGEEDEVSEWEALKWNPGGKVLIVVQASRERIRRMIQVIWDTSRTMSLVIANLHNLNNTIHFHSWLPYQAGQCSEVKNTSLLEVWKNGQFLRNTTIYSEKKVKTLNDCEMRVTSLPTVPFVFDGFKDGLEIRIVNTLQKYFNFTISYVFPPANELFWLPIVSNGTHTHFNGAFKLLVNQEADMAFAGITAQVDRYKYSSPLYPYIVERLIWIVPTPRLVPAAENVFRVFSPLLWLFVLVSLGIVAFLVFFTEEKRMKKFDSCLIYAFGLIFNGIPSIKTKNWSLRFITISTILLSIHIFVAYQSSLIFLLTTSILEKPYENVEELVNDGVDLLIYSAGQKLVDQAVKYKSIVLGHYSAIRDINAAFTRVAYDRTAFLLFPVSPSRFHKSNVFGNDSGRQLLMSLPNPFMCLPIAIHMSPGSPVTREFNHKIQQLVDAGIVSFWNNHIHAFITRKGSVVNKARNLLPLSINHLTGAFIIFLFLSVLSLLAFIIELITFQVWKRKKMVCEKNVLSRDTSLHQNTNKILRFREEK